MKKFIKYTLLFFSPILLLLIVSELLLRRIPNDYSYKYNYLNKGSNDIQVLYLGNSHIYYGIDPGYSRFKGFNASYISQSLDLDLAILEKYNNQWSGLKYIVIPVDYFSLYTSLESGIEEWRMKNYAIYYKINKSSDFKYQFEILNGKFSENLKRLKAYYFNHSAGVISNKSGWGTNYNSRNNHDLVETGQTSAKRHTVNITGNPCFDKNVQTIRVILDFAKKKNIKVIFLTCPAFRTYVEHLDQKQLSSSINMISKLSAESSNAVYYNLLNDTTFIEEDFYDADHLNEIGAKKMTLLVDSLIGKK